MNNNLNFENSIHYTLYIIQSWKKIIFKFQTLDCKILLKSYSWHAGSICFIFLWFIESFWLIDIQYGDGAVLSFHSVQPDTKILQNPGRLT